MRLLLILIFLVPATSQSQDCNCESNFNWVKKTFEENDAGFSYALESKGQASYKRHNEIIAQKVKSISNSTDCARILYEWLEFFRSGHLGIEILDPGDAADTQAKNASEEKKKPTDQGIRDQFKDWEKLEVDTKEFEAYLSAKNEADFEGIWQSGSLPYKIGIKKEGNNYLGFIIEADGVYWTKGQIKLRINQEGGQISSVYYMRDHSAEEFDDTKLLGKNYLQMGFITLKRIKPELESDPNIERYYQLIEAEKPYFEQLNETTSFLRIPSFSRSEKEDIDSVISHNKKKILNTQNLIIDLRDNGGGSDVSFNELLPIVYTNPVRTVGVEYRSTPLNNQRMLDFANNPEYGFDEEGKKWAKESYDKLSKHIGEFVDLDSIIVSISTFDTIYPYPKNIGIIINENNASTTEQFLLAAKQSKKVKLFGTTTYGALDISNVMPLNSPCDEYKLYYCLSRSMRIPEMTIDEKGIQPDYYIDKGVPSYQWIDFVSEVLNE